MWREWMYRVGLWLARHGGWSEGIVTAPYEATIESLRLDAAKMVEELAMLRVRMANTTTIEPDVFARATELTQAADTTLQGGEAKRHAVYARLIKDFPMTPKRELGLAIELALAPQGG